jgi:hypothetical protein
VPGRHEIVADPVTRRPCAFAVVARDCCARRPPAPLASGRHSRSFRAAAVGHSPFLRVRLTAASLRLRRALRRHAPATAPPLVESIDRLRAPRTRPVSCRRTTGPTFSRPRPGTECRTIGGRDIGRAPLLRFASPSTLAGRARAVRGGRPPDDPASAFAPVLAGPRSHVHVRTCRRDACALAVLRFSGSVATAARVADQRAGTFQPNPSLACPSRLSPVGPVAAGRRPVVLSPPIFDRPRG